MELIIQIRHVTKNGLHLTYNKNIKEPQIEPFIKALLGNSPYNPDVDLQRFGYELMPHYRKIQDIASYLGEI